MPNQVPTGSLGPGKRGFMRYGGIAMFLVGVVSSPVLPVVGVPMILLGIVFAAIGFTSPPRQTQ